PQRVVTRRPRGAGAATVEDDGGDVAGEKLGRRREAGRPRPDHDDLVDYPSPGAQGRLSFMSAAAAPTAAASLAPGRTLLHPQFRGSPVGPGAGRGPGTRGRRPVLASWTSTGKEPHDRRTAHRAERQVHTPGGGPPPGR